jgi:putative ATP-dependent endonuclease of the OLD family
LEFKALAYVIFVTYIKKSFNQKFHVMTITLKEVRIWNFRSLKEVQVILDPDVTVLVGANNSGKTNFLKALEMALGTNRRFVGKEDIFIGKDETLPKDRIAVIDILLIPTDNQGNRIEDFDEIWAEYWGDKIQGIETQAFVAIRTQIKYDVQHLGYIIKQCLLKEWKKWTLVDPNVWEKTSLSRKQREAIPLEFLDAQRDIYEDLRERSSFWGRMVADIPLNKSEIIEIENILNGINERIVNANEGLKKVKEKLALLNQTISNSDKGVSLTPIPPKLRDLNRSMDIYFQSEGANNFPLSHHGMGTRSWSSLLTLNALISHQAEKNNPYHPLLVLEEPEAHLHPQAQRHVFEQIKAIPGQKIVSTHSPYIVSQAHLAALRCFSRKEAETQVAQIDMSSLDNESQRKIRRQVLNTRGELLFARALVLFEGETEEQALPIFANAYWGKHSYELGISFIGVGGRDYLPFIRMAEGLGLKWFLFSDGERDTLKKLNSMLKKAGYEEYQNLPEIVVIDQNADFEQHLLNSGYQNELENVIQHHKLRYKLEHAQNEQHRLALESQWQPSPMTPVEIKDTLKKAKTTYAPLIAEALIQLPDETRRFPPKIKELFDIMAQKLNLPSKYNRGEQ